MGAMSLHLNDSVMTFSTCFKRSRSTLPPRTFSERKSLPSESSSLIISSKTFSIILINYKEKNRIFFFVFHTNTLSTKKAPQNARLFFLKIPIILPDHHKRWLCLHLSCRTEPTKRYRLPKEPKP